MTPITAPPNHKEAVNLWADEAIWGHRFHNDQTPWLVLLEFLAVFRSRHLDGNALNEPRKNGEHECIRYHIPRMTPLRQLVFNNPHIQHIESVGKSDGDCWNAWLNEIGGEYNFSYLKDRLRSFSRLARIIEFFQNTAVEAHRQRRWTSRFLFPYGPNCIYADLPGKISGSPDRRFFARGGELLYLMLSRSHDGPALAQKIAGRLLREGDRWDRVVRALLPDDYRIDPDSVLITSIGYLPFAKRSEYQALADDWHTLLDLNLPGATLLDPLMRISALHMLLYMVRRSHEEVRDSAEPTFVLEIAAPRKTPILELSADNLGGNRKLSQRAIHAYIDRAKEDERWRIALEARAPADAVQDFLRTKFSWKPEDGVPGGDPETIFLALRSYAEKRHSEHVAKVHTEWSRHIGLSVSRRGTGTWYAPDDALLKALVMTTVDGREEYHRFLNRIYERYRLVIGVKEAEDAYGNLPTDEKAFTQNTQRLEQRLRTLGLLRRLSDDCAYVVNPFRKRS
ncbi:hypothetical protein EVC37_16155 [Methylocaldum sp. BRCS4]|uniref:hypothetical protein n=1 Tax=Methylocaldum sp. 14B TaxID=1912213 RepID=UPI000989B67A|nr:hypothetical protein [Methylocaldum sp. 14B]MVF23135.1 hypothetical protein [Methylocaldum sp. BRCS4]